MRRDAKTPLLFQSFTLSGEISECGGLSEKASPSGKKGPELVASDAGWAFVIVAQALLRLFRGLAGRTHPGPCLYLYVKSAGTPVVVRCSGLHALRAAKEEPRASHIHMESLYMRRSRSS